MMSTIQFYKKLFIFLMVILFTLPVVLVQAQTAQLQNVSYGQIISVRQQSKDTSRGQRTGALIGGLAGIYSGRGKSGSNKALRALGGAAAGRAVGRSTSRGTENVYTVKLIRGGTVNIIMGGGSFHSGDCVAVEQGRTNNLRRVATSFCQSNVPEQYKKEHRREATECDQAKQEVLNASTDKEITTAKMKMDILCQD